MFEKTRLKLTTWYLVIIMAISVVFSVIIFSGINSDLTRFENMQARFQRDVEAGRVQEIINPRPLRPSRLNPEDIREARVRIIAVLFLTNLAILGFAGTAGYFLAGRTLRPIKQMMDDQNRFITDSSHELRTPLTSLRSEIEVALRNKSLNLANAEKVLKSNLEEVINLQKLSDGLLELSQNGNLVNRNLTKNVSLTGVIDSAIKKVGKLAKAKEIKIENSVRNVEIKGIEDRLVEVFVILLDNSIKYSSSKNKVLISSIVRDGSVRISVTDHGMGIPEQDLPHIFDRFYRGDKSRTENGYGLGLSIAKKIISSHNGKVSVKSIPGKETEFLVVLPCWL